MTQGELYKKIDTLRSLKTTNITKKDTANTGPLDFSKKRFRRAIHPIALIEIEKILDEAKKEFPAQFLNDLYKLGFYKNKQIYISTKMLSELNDWFEKWFGDANL